MKWNQVSLKLGAAIMFLFVLILVPLGIVTDQIFSDFYYSKVKQDSQQVARQYANMVANSNRMTLSMIEMMASFSQVKVYISNPSGEIVATIGVQGIQNGSNIARDEQSQLSLGQHIDRQWADESGRRFMVTGVPIISGGKFLGGVFVLSSIEEIASFVSKVRQLIIWAGVGALLLALGFSLSLSRMLSHPLIQMEKATRKIARGELMIHVPVVSNDEVGSLAQRSMI